MWVLCRSLCRPHLAHWAALKCLLSCRRSCQWSRRSQAPVQGHQSQAAVHINRHFGGCSGRLGNCPELLEVRRGEKTKKPSESLNCSLLPDDVGAAHPQHSCSPSSRKTLHLDISQAFYSGQFWLWRLKIKGDRILCVVVMLCWCCSVDGDGPDKA